MGGIKMCVKCTCSITRHPIYLKGILQFKKYTINEGFSLDNNSRTWSIRKCSNTTELPKLLKGILLVILTLFVPKNYAWGDTKTCMYD